MAAGFKSLRSSKCENQFKKHFVVFRFNFNGPDRGPVVEWFFGEACSEIFAGSHDLSAHYQTHRGPRSTSLAQKVGDSLIDDNFGLSLALVLLGWNVNVELSVTSPEKTQKRKVGSAFVIRSVRGHGWCLHGPSRGIGGGHAGRGDRV